MTTKKELKRVYKKYKGMTPKSEKDFEVAGLLFDSEESQKEIENLEPKGGESND